MGPASFNAPPAEPTAPATRENPLDTFLQQGRTAVASAQYSTMEVPGMLWGVCLLNASNGASFIGTASAATSSFYTDSEEYSKWLQELHAEAYAAAFSQLQQAENYCLRDKVAFLVRSGAMNGPVVADSIGKEPVEAAEGVTHLAARAEVSTEELKAEVLAEDFLKQKEL